MILHTLEIPQLIVKQILRRDGRFLVHGLSNNDRPENWRERQPARATFSHHQLPSRHGRLLLLLPSLLDRYSSRLSHASGMPTETPFFPSFVSQRESSGFGPLEDDWGVCQERWVISWALPFWLLL